jgi:hypothetical protein
LSLYQRQPDGTWRRREGPATDLDPSEVVAADLDGDGRLDLVVANNLFSFASLSFYHQNADGTFLHVRDVKVGTSVSDVQAADVNGDDRLDLLVTDADSGEVEVLLNEGLPPGAAGFLDAGVFRAGTGPYGDEESEGTTLLNQRLGPLAAAAGLDFSFPALFFPVSNEETESVAVDSQAGDGGPDLIVANRGSDTIALLRPVTGPGGRPTGQYGDPQVVAAGDRPSVVRVGNFFGNGDRDLAALNEDAHDLWIYQGDGQGGFTHTATIDAGPNPTGLTVTDVNGDRLDDLVVSSAFGDVLTLLGDGHGHFQAPNVRAVTLAARPDLLGPESPGVLVTNPQANHASIEAPDDGGRKFAQVQQLDSSAPTDGQPVRLERSSPLYDVVVTASGANSVLVYHATGMAGGTPTYDPPTSYFVGTDPVSVTVADVNGDGIPDLIAANQGSNDVSVLFGAYDANGNWIGLPGQRLQSAGVGPIAVNLVPDAGSPGGLDLAIVNQDGTVDVLPGRGQGFFDDRDPATLNLDRPLAQVSVAGAAGFAVTQQGQVIGFNLGNFSQQVISAGAAVTAVDALSGSSVLLAGAGGIVERLDENAAGLFQVTETFRALNGIPIDLTSLTMLGSEVLATSAGSDEVFVFASGDQGAGVGGVPTSLVVPVNGPPFDNGEGSGVLAPDQQGQREGGGGGQSPGTQGPGSPEPTVPPPSAPSGPVIEVTAPSAAPLTLVVTLVADVLPEVGMFPASDLVGGADTDAGADLADARPPEGPIDLEQRLRDPDLDEPPAGPDPDGPPPPPAPIRSDAALCLATPRQEDVLQFDLPDLGPLPATAALVVPARPGATAVAVLPERVVPAPHAEPPPAPTAAAPAEAVQMPAALPRPAEVSAEAVVAGDAFFCVLCPEREATASVLVAAFLTGGLGSWWAAPAESEEGHDRNRRDGTKIPEEGRS